MFLSCTLGPVSLFLCIAVPLLGPFAVFVSFLMCVRDAHEAANTLKLAFPEWSDNVHAAIGLSSVVGVIVTFASAMAIATAIGLWLAGQRA